MIIVVLFINISNISLSGLHLFKGSWLFVLSVLIVLHTLHVRSSYKDWGEGNPENTPPAITFLIVYPSDVSFKCNLFFLCVLVFISTFINFCRYASEIPLDLGLVCRQNDCLSPILLLYDEESSLLETMLTDVATKKQVTTVVKW